MRGLGRGVQVSGTLSSFKPGLGLSVRGSKYLEEGFGETSHRTEHGTII